MPISMSLKFRWSASRFKSHTRLAAAATRGPESLSVGRPADGVCGVEQDDGRPGCRASAREGRCFSLSLDVEETDSRVPGRPIEHRLTTPPSFTTSWELFVRAHAPRISPPACLLRFRGGGPLSARCTWCPLNSEPKNFGVLRFFGIAFFFEKKGIAAFRRRRPLQTCILYSNGQGPQA